MFCSDAQSAAFNLRYRGKPGPTDVLTFVYPWNGCAGEIYIALGVAQRQARTRNVTLRDELRRLTIHGLAHLAGYDHQTHAQFMAMRTKEFETLIQIL